MTTATKRTPEEAKACGQFFASLGATGILIHFVHELFTVFSDLPAVQVAVGVLLAAATVAVPAAWYKLNPAVRRALAAVLGAIWTIAASEHLFNLAGDGGALDYTGLLTVLGGLTLIFGAYWDYHRPLEAAR